MKIFKQFKNKRMTGAEFVAWVYTKTFGIKFPKYKKITPKDLLT